MSAAPTPLSLPRIGAVVAGNALEFYSFLIFSTFSVQIGGAYFPSDDPADVLLLTLATYGVGFLARPLGGVVIGTLGDTWGRRPTMVLSLSLMGLATAGMALTPSVAHIGAAAPVLVVLFRLLQGFALGGEVGPVTAILLEAAPPGRRTLYVAQQMVSQFAASMCAVLMGYVLTGLLSPEALAAWGWRAALLAGVAAIPAALIVRARLSETLYEAPSEGAQTTGSLLWLGLLGFCMVVGAAIASYTVNYLGIFVLRTLHGTREAALAASMAAGLCAIAGAFAGGFFSDWLGRKPVMIGGSLALLAAAAPCFSMMAHASPAWLVISPGVLGFLLGFYIPPALTSLAESLPVSLRAGSLGIIYALAAASFGGTAQFAIAWLIAVTGSPLAPAWYMAGGLTVGMAAMALMRESRPPRS